MRFAIALPCVLLALVLLASVPSAAQQADGLYVARAPVDATAESAAKARDQAIVQGQRAALQTVLRRLTPASMHDRLPPLDDAVVAQLVESLQVEKEKTSARRYIAELIVEFRPDGVRNLLRGVGLPFVEQRARPVLLLPVLEEGGQATLFDDPHPWREAWAKTLAARNGLVPLILPFGDIEDVAALSAQEAIAGDDAKLSALARRYGAARWAVAIARPGETGLTVSLLRPSGAEVETVDGADGDLGPAMLEAARRLAARLDDEWKNEATALLTAAPAGSEARLSASVPLRSLADWLTLRERLSRSPAVRSVDVLAISARGAQIVLRHVGTPEQLAQTLALQDVELVQDQGFWRVGLRGSQALR